jgi:succinate dehydrogenase / fumarate reductase flavoprotein subunit
MQGLADGYFILPYTIGDYLASTKLGKVDSDDPASRQAVSCATEQTKALLSINGSRSVDSFHRELGKLLWDECGMSRTAEGLQRALGKIPELRDEFWKNVRVLGSGDELNQSLEKAGRVADFLEFGELMCLDALMRNESCGGHFREEYQTPEGEALRDDEHYSYVAAWEYQGQGVRPALNKEPLDFEYVHPAQRSYK